MIHFQNPGSKFRHFSPPHSNFQNIDWSTNLLSVGLSDEGNNGVVFIETKQGSLVFKACDQVSTDLFLSKIAQKLLIPTPKIRVIGYDCQEFKQMMRAIEKYCHQNQNLYELISRRLNRPFYQLLEYVPCMQLKEIGKERFQVIFKDQERLYQLGKIIAFDIIMNNSDRLSLYWEIEGNANNVLFKIRAKTYNGLTKETVMDQTNITDIAFEDIVMIDARPTIIDKRNPEATKNYEMAIETMANFIQRLIIFAKQQDQLKCQKLGSELFQEFNNHFYNYTTCKFNNEQLLLISKSILICLYDFYVAYPIKSIQQLIQSLKRDNKLWEDTHWNEQLDKMHISYFEGVREVLQKNLIPEEQIIRIWRSENKFGGSVVEESYQEEEQKEQEKIPEQLLQMFNLDKKEEDVDEEKESKEDEENQDKESNIDSSSRLQSGKKPSQKDKNEQNEQQQKKSQSLNSMNSFSNPNIKSPIKNVKQTLEQKLSKFRAKNLKRGQ